MRIIFPQGDDTYFPIEDAMVLDIPDDLDGEDIEEYISEHSEDAVPVLDMIGSEEDGA